MSLKIIDIGHRNHASDEAILVLATAVSNALHDGEARVIKVIHGHGSGALRKNVRVWCDEQQGRFKAVIPGERYALFDENSRNMRTECGIKTDADFGRGNHGVTYIWLV